jgi:hypothetical protein
MKKWNRPLIDELEVGFTAGGGLGGGADGTWYQVNGKGIFSGTGGPDISDPRFVKVDANTRKP